MSGVGGGEGTGLLGCRPVWGGLARKKKTWRQTGWQPQGAAGLGERMWACLRASYVPGTVTGTGQALSKYLLTDTLLALA